MTGTEQGDFSRVLLEPGKRYGSVRMQQGRVLLDSDWNAEMDLLAHRLRTETRDTLGPAGAPAGDAGFAIEAGGLLSFDGRGRFIALDAAGALGADGADGTDGGFTFEARFYPRAGSAPSTLLSRLVSPAAGPPVAELRLDLDDEGRLTLLRAGDEGAPLTAAGPVAFDHLNHLALVYDARSATLYLNGVAVAADRRGGPLAAGENLWLAFGAALDEGGVRRGADGVLVDLRLWRRALDAGEIRAGVGGRRADGSREEAKGLIGAWRFDRPAPAVEDRGGRGRRWLLGGGDPAHAPQWLLHQVSVGRGRYYVEGLLCENPETVPFQSQPDHPGARLPRFSRDRVYLFYLDAWELLVTAEQDPGIAEVALGGADTTARTRTVAQVDVLPLPADALGAAGYDGVPEAWHRFAAAAHRQGRLRARRVASAEMLGNLLYRVEMHTSGGLYGWPRPPAPDEPVLEAERVHDDGGDGKSVRLRLAAPPDPAAGRWRPGDRLELWSEETDRTGRAGPTAILVAFDPVALTVEVERTEPTAPALLGKAGPDPAGTDEASTDEASTDKASTDKAGTGVGGAGGEAGWLGPGDRFRLRRIATFKWSRQNASVLCPLAEVEPGARTVILADPGRRGIDLAVGDWVEYCDADTLLAPHARPLYRIETIDESLLQVTLSGAPIAPASEAGAYPALRRWDQRRGSADTPLVGGTLVATPGWLPLEAGIEVSFAGDGPYRATDFWWLPARTRTEDIEWPQEGDGGGPAARPPVGVTHRYACLAVLAFGDDGYDLRDCRRTFRPLVDGAVSKAGDTMYGPLVIRSSLTVEGAGPEDPGAVAAEVYYGPLGSPDSVTTPNLADRSVTAPKLAADVGMVPPGYAILGPTPQPPPGYSSAGSSFTVFHSAAAWNELAPFPRRDPGPLRGAAAAGRLWVVLESGELWEYEPRTGRWRARRPRPEPLQDFAVAALGGRIYVVGGFDPRRGKSGGTLVYDPDDDRWSAGSEMPTRRSRLALAAAGGKLYALGGLIRSWLGERVSRANEEYDPEGDRWTRRAPLPRRRYDLGAGGAAGAVHAVGGVGRPLFGLWGRTVTSAHEQYQPASDRWLRGRAALAAPAAHPGVAALDDHLFVAGGEGALGPLAETAEYDPSIRAWRRRPPLPVPAAWIAAGAPGGTLYAAADAAGCPSPPLWELPAANRYYIFTQDEGAEPPDYGEPDDVGEPGAAASDRAFEELTAELDVLPDIDETLLE